MADLVLAARASRFNAMMFRRLSHSLTAAAVIGLAGCATTLNPMARMTQDMPVAMASMDDPQLVAEAVPNQIVLIETMLVSQPENPDHLAAAATLYSIAARLENDDPARAQRLSDRAMRYAEQAFDKRHPALGGIDLASYAEFEDAVAAMTVAEIPDWYTWASVRADWMRLRPDDPDAQADVSRVTAVFERIAALDSDFRDGAAHMYVGVLYAMIPADFGGDLQKSRRHFELARAQNGERDLMTLYMYASTYAQAAGDTELRDSLMDTVLDADPQQGRFTLSNVIAQRQAREWLNKSAAAASE